MIGDGPSLFTRGEKAGFFAAIGLAFFAIKSIINRRKQVCLEQEAQKNTANLQQEKKSAAPHLLEQNPMPPITFNTCYYKYYKCLESSRVESTILNNKTSNTKDLRGPRK